MSKTDPRMTPRTVLPGEMFDIEQFERDLAADEIDDLALALMSDEEYAALENWEPDCMKEAC